ncbi:efflux RND transporter permease subunit [Pseudovibrio sp. SPO723]|uniref:efflux RND transporter permease subunit n=1 Tax=Nesiotobacter zosterae TaxID=392721 RepID=UPI0029C5C7EA|nr:efflux RND transporter permease subunit [Pseudovibrio sp. SPO723]MDX5595480.1 efflux RND transporter permease subunit [Pseudovibrio sp. SPO723]
MKGNLSAWSLSNKKVALYFMVLVILAGVTAFVNLGRDEDPPFTIRTMLVQAAWPGAATDETLLQVTERLERALQETPGLDRIDSQTRPGHSVLFVHLLDSTPKADVPMVWQNVRNRVADMAHTLPQGVIGPAFNDEFGDTFGVIYGFTADGFSQRELRDYVEHIRSELLRVEDVSKIELLGIQEETIFVEFDPSEIAALGLPPGAVRDALRAQNLVAPAGTLRTGTDAITVTVSGAFNDENDLREIVLTAGDARLRLGDVARISRGYADPPQPLFRVNGKDALGIAISMRDGGDVIALGENLEARITELRRDLPIGIESFLVANQPEIVDTAIAEFTESLWQAIAIVLVISFIALGVRAGIVVAVAIPLTMAAVFVTMQLVGIDLQRISLGALIIALGLLVDDAMTTVDSMTRRLAAGDDAFRAGSYAYDKLAFAMLTGAFVTIAGFVPIGFAESSAGEYTFSIFAVVAIALIASWLIAVLFVPVVGVAVLRPPKPDAKTRESALMLGYRALLALAMRARILVVVATIGLFVLSVLGLSLVPRQFFPPSDRVELLVDLTLPQGASIHTTRVAVDRFEAKLEQLEGISHWSSYIGRGAIRFYLPLDVQTPNPFFAQFVVVTNSIEDRLRLQPLLEETLIEEFPEAISRVYALELGPPVGWPIQYRVTGSNLEEVRSIARDVAEIIAGVGDVRSLSFNWMEPSRDIRVVLDQDEARRLGISAAAVSDALNLYLSGTPVTQIRDDIYLIPVVTRAEGGQTLSPERLANLQIAIGGGRTVPLSQITRLDYDLTDPLVHRRDRVAALTVQADIQPGLQAATVVDRIEPELAELRAGLPKGYTIDTGGLVEESAESQASVFAVVPFMLLLVLTILMVQLRDFRLVGMVLFMAPLGMIGVVGALLLSGQPLGFVAILGVLALVGMISKNAVILIEQIEDERRSGKPVRAAVIEAAASRLRPILLTALSTVLGLVPIAFTVFWGAMAFAIMGGLAVASFLTLLVLPVLYDLVFNRGELAEEPSGSDRSNSPSPLV